MLILISIYVSHIQPSLYEVMSQYVLLIYISYGNVQLKVLSNKIVSK